MRIGSFNYTADSNQLAGTWRHDDWSSGGTWYATLEDPTTFIDNTPEPPVSGENEACDYWDETSWSYVQCEEGLMCAASGTSGEFICTVAPEHPYAGINEDCGYFESAQMHIECDMGLFCDYGTDSTMGACKEYTDYSEGSDGIFIGQDGENSFWFFNEDRTGGHWIAENGSVEGLWMYD